MADYQDSHSYSQRDFGGTNQIVVKKLTEKLANLQSGIEEEKKARQDANTYKVRALQEKIQKLKASEEAKFNAIKEEITKLQEGLATERVSREILDERKYKECKLLENNFSIDLNLEKQSRKDSSTKMEKLAEEKLFTIKLELTKEKRQREENDESNLREFANQIAKLQDAVEGEKRIREESYERIVKSIGEEINAMFDKLEEERRIREESHLKFGKMLGEMQARVRQELVLEKRERENTEETLIRLLEETCQRVEIGLGLNSQYQNGRVNVYQQSRERVQQEDLDIRKQQVDTIWLKKDKTSIVSKGKVNQSPIEKIELDEINQMVEAELAFLQNQTQIQPIRKAKQYAGISRKDFYENLRKKDQVPCIGRYNINYNLQDRKQRVMSFQMQQGRHYKTTQENSPEPSLQDNGTKSKSMVDYTKMLKRQPITSQCIQPHDKRFSYHPKQQIIRTVSFSRYAKRNFNHMILPLHSPKYNPNKEKLMPRITRDIKLFKREGIKAIQKPNPYPTEYNVNYTPTMKRQLLIRQQIPRIINSSKKPKVDIPSSLQLPTTPKSYSPSPTVNIKNDKNSFWFSKEFSEDLFHLLSKELNF